MRLSFLLVILFFNVPIGLFAQITDTCFVYQYVNDDSASIKLTQIKYYNSDSLLVKEKNEGLILCGNLLSIPTTTYYSYNDKDLLIKKKCVFDSIDEYSYDSSITVYQYDSLSRLLMQVTLDHYDRDEFSVISSGYKYYYSKDNRLKKKVYYYWRRPVYVHKYKYDETGYLIKHRYTRGLFNTFNKHYRAELNSKGQLVSLYNYRGAKGQSCKIEYFHTPDGLLSRKIVSSLTNDIIVTTLYEYTF